MPRPRTRSQVGLLPYGEDEVKAESLNTKATGFTLQEAIRTRQFWILSVVFFCGFFNVNVVMVHIVIHATGMGISSIAAVTILSAAAGISIAGRIIAGGVADRIGNRPSLIIGFSLTVVAFLWLLVAKELWMLYLFAILFGLGGWVTAPVGSPVVVELFGLRAHGAILGVAFFVATVGGAVGPVLAGHIFDITSSYYLAFLVCIAISVVSLILISLLTPLARKEGTSDS